MSTKHNCVRWAFDLSQWRPTLNELSLAISCIQPVEKIRLSKFYFRDDFDASLIGRLLMRKFVRDTTAIDYDQIIFNRDNRGKPFLVNVLPTKCHQLDFNVSHQGAYSVLAGITFDTIFSSPVKIGVDVMKIEYSGGKPLTEFFRLMHRNFSDEEWKYIRKQSSDREQLKAFMRHWCLKESYVKNVGVGITVNLQKISFKIKTEELCPENVVGDTQVEVDGNLLKNWTFEEHMLDSEHCAAIAFENLPNSFDANRFKVLEFSELIKDAVPLSEPDDEYCKLILAKDYKKK